MTKAGVTVDSLMEAGATRARAKTIVAALPRDASPPDAWAAVANTLSSVDDFSIHLHVFDAVYAAWDRSRGPRPAWTPSHEEVARTNIARFSKAAGVSHESLHQWSVENREAFWRQVLEALAIGFRTPPRQILDVSKGPESPRWLAGASLNIAKSCFQADDDAIAVVYQAEGGTLQRMTYGELDRLSNRVANSLAEIGLRQGDAVAIDMIMTVEAVAAYLGIVKAGAVVVSIADSFAPDEIATRLRIAGARAVVTQDVLLRAGKTLPMYDKVVQARAERVVVIPATGSLQVELREGDVAWENFLVDSDRFEPVACDPDDATNVLFSSGTTGDPKAIPWTHTTPIKCAMDGYLHHDIQPGDVVAWPTNLGWMMGPWLIYASLVNRGTMALYYGAANTRPFCEFVRDAQVNMLGLVPSLVKAWRNANMADGIDWSSIKLFSSTGEASNAEDYLYLMSLAHYRPVVEYCGGTEIGGGYITGTLVQPASPATFSTPAYGLDFHVLDDDGKPNRSGEVFLVPPSIGLSTRLFNRDHHEVYYEGTPTGPNGELLRRHGDQMERLGAGYLRAQGRADDTMNLSGIKVSSAEIERAVSVVEGIVETAAIAVDPPGGGPSRLVIFVVPKPETRPEPATVKSAMQRAIAEGLNPLFKIYDVQLIDALPRTASNKVMRRVLRDRCAA